MTLIMPAPEPEILARRDELIERLRAILPAYNLIVDETARRAYECDAFTMYRALPLVVALGCVYLATNAAVTLATGVPVYAILNWRGAGTAVVAGGSALFLVVAFVLAAELAAHARERAPSARGREESEYAATVRMLCAEVRHECRRAVAACERERRHHSMGCSCRVWTRVVCCSGRSFR